MFTTPVQSKQNQAFQKNVASSENFLLFGKLDTKLDLTSANGVLSNDVFFGSANRRPNNTNQGIPEHVQVTAFLDEDQGRIVLDKTSAGEFVIRDTQTNQDVGVLKTPSDSLLNDRVELFMGKGGFAAVIQSENGTRYFALPGSSVKLGDIDLTLNGTPMSSSISSPSQIDQSPAQSLTPQVMVLGAGMATRFEPVSGENTGYSKPAVPLVGDRSVIKNIIELLKKNGFSSVFINTMFKPESLKQSLASESISYINESEPSGTAGGLRKLLETPAQYGFDNTKPILIVQGDAVTDVNFAPLMAAHQANNALVTIGCQDVDVSDVDKFGIVVTDNSNDDGISGKIQSFQEKPKQGDHLSTLANTGFYVISPEAFPILLDVFNEMGDAGKKELDYAKHFFPEVLKRVQAGQTDGKPFYAQKVEGYWADIGNPTQYIQTVQDIYSGNTSIKLPDNVNDYFENGVIFWPGAKERVASEGAEVSGNAIVAVPFSQAGNHHRNHHA